MSAFMNRVRDLKDERNHEIHELRCKYMLKLLTTSICLNPEELAELERIVLDDDSDGALKFLKRLHGRLEASQVRCGDK